MKNKDTIMLEEAYNLILEAKKKKLTPKEKKLAGAAAPYDKITRADIITLAKNKKTKNESAGIEDQEEHHCEAASHGCDCDGCEECKANQKEEVKEDAPVASHDFKVGDMVTLNHPNYPAMNGKKFTVQQANGGKCDLVGVDQHGYSEPRNGVFWVDNEYLAPLS